MFKGGAPDVPDKYHEQVHRARAGLTPYVDAHVDTLSSTVEKLLSIWRGR